MTYIKIATTFKLLIISALCFSEVRIASYHIPGLIEPNNSGHFQKINEAIFSKINTRYQLSINSTQKAQIMFFTGQSHVIFPELDEGLNRYKHQGKFIKSDAIFKKPIILYRLKSSKRSAQKLYHGESIGIVRGFSYGDRLTKNPHLQIETSNSDSINLQRLLAGEVDGILGDIMSTEKAIETLNIQHLIKYDKSKPANLLDTFYVCHNTEQGVQLCNDISKAIAELKQEGIIKTLPSITTINLELVNDLM